MVDITNKFTYIFVILLFITSCIYGENYKAKVIGVTDGDTIKILRDDKVYKVRLYGIDAPEMSQKYGIESKNYLNSIIQMHKEVSIEEINIDRYKRIVAIVYVNSLDVNLDMIKKG